MKKTLLLSLGAFALAASANAQLTIVGGSTLNGNFNADTSLDDKRTFADTPDWVNIGSGGDQSQEATRIAPAAQLFDGSRNAVLSEAADRAFGLDTGYSIVEGETFTLNFVWRDAFQWDDGGDQLVVNLFTTNTDAIDGTRNTLASLLSGTSTANNSYQAYNNASAYTAIAADVGKTLFVEVTTQDGGSGADGFARIDNFELITSVPEPSSFALVAGCLCLGYVMIRRRK